MNHNIGPYIVDFNSIIYDYAFTIIGEPASKSNARRLIKIKKKFRVIKSKKAIDYVGEFKKQLKDQHLELMIEGRVCLFVKVWYASWRPDLDIELIKDAMQGIIYRNDRQVVEQYACRYLDKDNPRIEVKIVELDK